MFLEAHLNRPFEGYQAVFGALPSFLMGGLLDIWLFAKIGGPFRGWPCGKNPNYYLGSISGPLVFGNCHAQLNYNSNTLRLRRSSSLRAMGDATGAGCVPLQCPQSTLILKLCSLIIRPGIQHYPALLIPTPDMSKRAPDQELKERGAYIRAM